MPIYEYICRTCGHKFELSRHFYDSDEEVMCPNCGEKSATKQPSSLNSPNCSNYEVSYRSTG
jgi:putative FmdB family regulatory protein